MALSTRERSITLLVLIIVGAFAADRLGLEPYFDRRRELTARRLKQRQALDEANHLLQTEQRMRTRLASLGAMLKPDPADAEAQVLRLLTDLQQQAGVSNASFQRVRTADEHGYTHLTFHLTAAGPMPALAAFLYRVETAKIPLRLDDVQVAPRRESADDLLVQANVSTLAKSGRPGNEPTVAVAGGQP